MKDTNNIQLKEKFKFLKQFDKLNTSYPIVKEQWEQYKTDGEITFDDKKICMYVHIPFCKHLCKFCEYIKFAKKNHEEERQYLEILVNQIEDFCKDKYDKILCGLDIGGGTPTILDDDNFDFLINSIDNIVAKFKKSEDFMPSIESTFESINEHKIHTIAKSCFKRISFGLQTFDKKVLKNYGRKNGTIENILNIINLCRSNGIKIINIDLMYGLKYTTKQNLKETMNVLKLLNPEHLTFYEFRTNILNIKEVYTKKQLFNQYCLLYKIAIKQGYKGNFGQNTFSKLDNNGLSSYIENRMIKFVNYKGFGISAQSKGDNGICYEYGKNHEKYSDCFHNGKIKKGDTYILPKKEMLAKYIAISGYYGCFDLEVCSHILGKNFEEEYIKELIFLKKKKLIMQSNNKILLTKKGFKYYGAILAMFYNFDNIKKF